MWGNNSNNNSLSLNPNVQSDNNYGVDYTGRKTDNKTTSAEHTFQIDYSAPVSSILTVETGGKYIFRPKKSDGFTYLNNGGILSLLDDQTVKTTNNDNIGALYAQVSAKSPRNSAYAAASATNTPSRTWNTRTTTTATSPSTTIHSYPPPRSITPSP
ncbi:MAG: outer membrane beta-barrel protein [Bacteroidales bacterium]|nr:outer membrane beta-barrel protein [Bacteroidales bacterium]